MSIYEELYFLENEIRDRSTIVLYEPGAGGDFFVTLLSFSDSLLGNDIDINHMISGRIKTQSNNDVLSYNGRILNDYEFFENKNLIQKFISFDDIKNQIIEEDRKFIIKIHPYIYRYGVEPIYNYLKKEYPNNKIICLIRDEEFTIKNHQHKNGSAGVMEKNGVYNKRWFEQYQLIKDNFDVIDVKFKNVLINPFNTIEYVCNSIGYKSAKPQMNEMEQVYTDYLNNQKHIEPFERYWK